MALVIPSTVQSSAQKQDGDTRQTEDCELRVSGRNDEQNSGDLWLDGAFFGGNSSGGHAEDREGVQEGVATGAAVEALPPPHWTTTRMTSAAAATRRSTRSRKGGVEAPAVASVVAAGEAAAARKIERDGRRAEHNVAPMGKRGRWGGINSTAVGRETSSPEILSPLRRGGSEWT